MSQLTNLVRENTAKIPAKLAGLAKFVVGADVIMASKEYSMLVDKHKETFEAASLSHPAELNMVSILLGGLVRNGLNAVTIVTGLAYSGIISPNTAISTEDSIIASLALAAAYVGTTIPKRISRFEKSLLEQLVDKQTSAAYHI